MKLLILFALVAACSGSAIPVVPGDNSHYVEGESRYIWMPDGEGVPHLVDLHEPVDEELLNSRNGANNQYWLFTRQNPTSRQVLVHNNINSVRNSNYRANRGCKVIIHGWNNNGDTHMNPLITSAFLAVQDVNVIVVDWRQLASANYNTAAAGVPGVGNAIGNFLVWLINNGGGNWNNVHIVGFSLGAHAAGRAGHQAGRRPSRVTGLDPAGPQWGGNANALNRNAGRYVEAIHTDGRALGIMNAIADADFYPNGGRHPQPGCILNTCSHGRAPELFASSVRQSNRFVGRRCVNLWEAELATCNGATLHMGNAIVNKGGFIKISQLASANYNTAAAGVPGVGNAIGNFLVWLINNGGGNWNNVHIVGFSLGAHAAGRAGHQAGRRPSRVTGLDPAGPQWGGNANALNRNAGRYVEAIHTDGRALGIMNAIADADFYPNGGRHPQPGCILNTCSHGRAPELFASSVRQSNRFVGRRCVNLWEAELATCNGATLHMGNAIVNKGGSGLFGLITRNAWPF